MYEILEVSPRASHAIIQAAYRTLARSTHPDISLNADAEVRIRQLNAAYLVLSDAERRARYDFERSRSRPRQRVVRQVAHPSVTNGRSQVLPWALTPAVETRLPLLRGGVVLVLILLVALTTLCLILVLGTMDLVS